MHQGHWLMMPETGNGEQPHSRDGPDFLTKHPGSAATSLQGWKVWMEGVKDNQVVAKAFILLVLKQSPISRSTAGGHLLYLACDILKALSQKVLLKFWLS